MAKRFLEDIATEVPKKEGLRQIICLDNGSWHKAKSLNWHHFEPYFQPAYSPDLNPIEQLWHVIKENFFAGYIAKDKNELTNRIEKSIKFYIINNKKISSTCSTNCFKRT